jgi:predicted metal-dependent hydrolase
MEFDEVLAEVPKHFAADGDLILSHLAAALSSVFPDGEDFFVKSVRHFRDRITDPELKRQVAGFIGQEAVHGREHRVFNDRLDDLGYGTKRAERLTKWGLAARWKVMSPTSNLAMTAALEHYTATLAELLLTNEEVRGYFGDPNVEHLFVWHALEESEHKSVAFDVYKAVGGRELLRTITMNLITVGFVGGMTLQVVLTLLTDRDTYRRGKLQKSWRRFRSSPIMEKELWQRLRDYNRRDFHPDDHDNSELTAAWRERLFGSAGELNDLLAGSTDGTAAA